MAMSLSFLRPARPAALVLTLLLTVGLTACGDENTAQVSLDKARNFRAEGKLTSAVIELRSAEHANPDNAELHYLFGLIHAEDVGDGDSAESELLRARELGMAKDRLRAPLALTWILKGDYHRALDELGPPDDFDPGEVAPLMVLYGRAQIGLRDFAAADDAFKRALQVRKDYVPALVGLGRSAVANGRNLSKANTYLARALVVAPNDRGVLHLQGYMAFLKKDYAQAEKVLTEGLRHYKHFAPMRLTLVRALLAQNKLDAAVKNLDESFLPNPNDPARVLLRAQAAFQVKNYDLAKQQAEQALALKPGSTPATLLAAAANYATGGYEAARKHMESFLRGHPDNVAARKLYGAALIKLGRAPEAYSILRPLAEKVTDDATLMSLIGSAALAGGDLQAAERFMEKAVEIRPNRPQDRAKLGITKIVLGNSEEGVQDLDSFLEGVESPTAQSARAFLRAYRAGNYLEALTAARALRKESTDNPLPLTLIGLARLALKDNGGAAEAFSEALKLDYDFVPAITGMGALAMQQGNLQAALEQYEKAQRLKPNRLLVLLRLAQVQLKLGKEFEAVGYLEQAVQKYPTALTPRILLGQIQFRSGHPDRALALTAEMVEHYPANPGLLEVVGRAQMATNHKAEAVATFRKLVEILPNSPASHYYLAVAYRNLGDAARYGSSLDKSLALDPKYFRALMEKARFKLAENKLAESRKLVDEIKANNPNRADVLELDGTLALAEGHLDTSVETLKRAYDMVGNTRVVIQLAQAYWLSGRQDDALALMKGWLAKVPADTRVRLKYANLLLALNKVKEAHGHLEAVVEAAPNNVLARNNLAWTLHRLGRDSSALLHAEKALELAPGNPGVMDTLGVILMGQGKSDEALVLLRRAAKAQSDIPAVQYHYAKALAKAGQRQEAVRILTSVLGDKQISFAEIDDAKALLQTLKKK